MAPPPKQKDSAPASPSAAKAFDPEGVGPNGLPFVQNEVDNKRRQICPEVDKNQDSDQGLGWSPKMVRLMENCYLTTTVVVLAQPNAQHSLL